MEAVRIFRNVREYLTPVLIESNFEEKGMLTPEEFVRAGDHLVRTCPTWQWESGEKSKIRPYLPEKKQYLATKGVPCYSRVTTLQDSRLVESTVDGGMLGVGADGDWCAPDLLSPTSNELEDEFLVDAEDAVEGDGSAMKVDGRTASEDAKHVQQQRMVASAPSSMEDEYADMEDESLALDDSTTTATMTPAPIGDMLPGARIGRSGRSNDNPGNGQNNSIVYSRRYDVSITYDNYYRTPRIWLFGFNENGSPLKPEDVFEDIIKDYAQKTVTIDPHPHLSLPHASIHPCQHGAAMLSIVKALKACSSNSNNEDEEETGNGKGTAAKGSTPSIDQYLFIFLKFIQSVVPTIEYDYTTDVQVRALDAEDGSDR